MSWPKKNTLVAVPTHRGRVSPVFEMARHLLLVRIEDSRELRRRDLILDGMGVPGLLDAIRSARGEALVCGAVCNYTLCELLSGGIAVWPAVVGDVEEVIACLTAKGALDERFMMPGLAAAADGRVGVQVTAEGAFGRRWGWHEPSARGLGIREDDSETRPESIGLLGTDLRPFCSEGNIQRDTRGR